MEKGNGGVVIICTYIRWRQDVCIVVYYDVVERKRRAKVLLRREGLVVVSRFPLLLILCVE